MTGETGTDQVDAAGNVTSDFHIDWRLHGLLRVVSRHDFTNVLDIGAGAGEHKRFLALFGKQVYSVDILKHADYVGDFMEVALDRRFDLIWCSRTRASAQYRAVPGQDIRRAGDYRTDPSARGDDFGSPQLVEHPATLLQRDHGRFRLPEGRDHGHV